MPLLRLLCAGVWLVVTVSWAAASETIPLFERGHLKGQWLSASYPDDSLFRDAVGAVTHDQGAELRLNFQAGSGAWSIKSDYQFLARFGDSLELNEAFGDLFLIPQALPGDDRRWWDLTQEISEGDSKVLVQRLDRLHLGYAGEKTVLRFGRQAVSWGNGLIYNPMDFFNPFDPAAVDTEYKLGDDMFYGQYLLDNGSDWQLVCVQRRDEYGEVTSAVRSTALKFHGFAVAREYDLLVSEHFDELVLAVGGSTNLGDAVLRGDLMFTDTEDDWVTSLVGSWSYSWEWGGHNVSAVAEYFFNGFGLRESDYGPEKFAEADDLTERIRRGELFNVGRHYLAGSMTIEVTPLFNVVPNLFLNLGDGSALAQLVAQWDVSQNWQVLASVNVPVGPAGTEYGGLDSRVEGLQLSTGPALFAQLAFYF